MFVTDPDDITDDTITADPATAAAEPVDDTAEALAAMDQGIEQASEPEPEAVEPVADEPEADLPEGAEPPKDDKAPEATPDKETEDEIASLGLKEKSAARFRELTAEVKALAPIKEQLERAGIKDFAQIPQLVKRAEDGDFLVESIEKTGVSPDDFNRLLTYGGTIAAARTGDRAATERAFEEVGKEYAAIARALGKEIPGVFDPLEEHEDLRTAIESGDMGRQHAIEVAQARRTQAAIAQRNEATQQQQSQQQQQQALVQQGVQSLVQWEQAKMAQDPAYASKRAALNAKVVEIRKQFPPAQWSAATELAYQAIAAPAPAQAPRAPGNAVRPGGPRAPMAPATFDNPMDALDFGIQQASG